MHYDYVELSERSGNNLRNTGKTIRILLGLLLPVAMASSADSQNRVRLQPVDVWSGGDDGYTLRLRDALEVALKKSGSFQLIAANKPGKLVVTIPSSVQWTREGERTKITYKVEYSSIGNVMVIRKSGSCWEDEMNVCAHTIVTGAQTVAQFLKK